MILVLKVYIQDISEASGGSKHSLAFGWGPRYCGGSEFAKLQMAIFLHYLVTEYRY
jgi:cytochrome P450